MTYTHHPDGTYTLTTEHGTFTGKDWGNVKLKALMAENDAKWRRECVDRHREIAREVQAQELAMREAQGR